MNKTVIYITLIFASTYAQFCAAALDGLFGERLGEQLTVQPSSTFKGSENEPNVSYFVKTPDSFPVKELKYFVANIDTETKTITNLNASVPFSSIIKCSEKREHIANYLSDQFKGVKTDGYSWRQGARGASVSCMRREQNLFLLSIDLNDFELNRMSEDKYIKRLYSVND